MKIIIVGLGSMGKRRLRLLRQIDQEIEIIGVDSNTERIAQVEQEYGIICKENIEEAVNTGMVDGGFVCTSPLSHKTIIKDLLSRGLHVFTEINLISDDYNELINLANEKNKVLFLSSTFLYRRDIQVIIDSVSNNKVNYLYHTGQYLPDWHPWESYKDFFVSDIRTNGCREIMAIEFPWLVRCFGDIEEVRVVKGDNLTNLELGYCDNYLMIIKHKSGNKGMIAVDIASRKARRSLDVYGENVHILWDGTPNSLQIYDIEHRILESINPYEQVEKDYRYCDNIIENAYADEIRAFLNELTTGSKDKTLYSFDEDAKILEWINRIEYGE